MKKKMEQKVNQAFSHIVPNVLESVLSDCEGQEGKVFEMSEMKNSKKKSWTRWAAGIAAAFALLAGGTGLGMLYKVNHDIAATISLDVNPSIEITVNQKEKVLSVLPRNEDAKKIVGNMDFKGSDLEVTVNALIGSMLRGGYLNEVSNSILVSVDGSDPARGTLLQQKLTAEIDGLLQTDTFRGAVLSQTISHNAQVRELADRYGITEGKAQLIQQLVSGNGLYQFEDLVPLSINELNLLTGTAAVRENLNSTGSASEKAYIGEESARQAALTHAGLTPQDILLTETKLDYEHGKMVYEIEFYAGGYEYEYDIDALTGDVLEMKREAEDEHRSSSSVSPAPSGSGTSYIGEAAAKAAALTHAGVAEGDIQGYRCKLDQDGRVVHYEIEFYADIYEYEYDIDAVTGEILDIKREAENGHHSSSAPSGSGTSYIGEATAKAAALTHAGVAEGDIQGYRCKLDRDDRDAHYEIEFYSGSTEYDYDISAFTGEVIKYEQEQREGIPVSSAASNTSYIGEGRAKSIALSHAGVDEGNIRKYECELDSDDGRMVYKMEFESGAYEYEYEIDAYTGDILKHQKDLEG